MRESNFARVQGDPVMPVIRLQNGRRPVFAVAKNRQPSRSKLNSQLMTPASRRAQLQLRPTVQPLQNPVLHASDERRSTRILDHANTV
jgi:hypothetical protein